MAGADRKVDSSDNIIGCPGKMPSDTLYGKRLTFHIEEQTAQILREVASKRRVRMSDLLREAVDAYVRGL